MGNLGDWIEIDPQMVPAEQREATRFCNEAFSKVKAAANGAADADQADIAMMALETEWRQEDGQLSLNRCKGTAGNYGKQCWKCKVGEQHKFAGFVPQTSLDVVGDDSVQSIAAVRSAWAGHVTPHRPDHYMVRREANVSFGRRLDALPAGLREVARVIDATHDDRLTNRGKADMLARMTGERWTERRFRRVSGFLKKYLLARYPEKLRRISGFRGATPPTELHT